MASLSGSAVADTAALAAVLMPMMRDAGYRMDRSAGLIAAGGIIAPVIPPAALATSSAIAFAIAESIVPVTPPAVVATSRAIAVAIDGSISPVTGGVGAAPSIGR
jgi:TRAP-type C4-dicarboxylate transport system permease large subunit